MHIQVRAHNVMAQIGQYSHGAYKLSVIMLYVSICPYLYQIYYKYNVQITKGSK